ncbi:MAG: SBBP repeat-containing protein [Candidatus Aminicenantes bacterium]
MRRSFLLSAAVLGVSIVFLALGTRSQAPPPLSERVGVETSPSVRVDPDFGKIALHFIPNRGQIGGSAVFYVQGRDKTICFAPEGLTFVLSRMPESEEGHTGQKSDAGDPGIRGPWTRRAGWPLSGVHSAVPSFERWVVKLDFVDADPDAVPVSLEDSGAVVSYFQGKAESWKAGIPASSEIIYRGLWPGIDLVYSGTVSRMKYEFIVHPGADPSKIRLAYRGADRVALTEGGQLQVETPLGGFTDDVPTAWQEIGGGTTSIEAAYDLCSLEGDRHIWGFKVGEYDRARTLILDPAVLVYCGFIGGGNTEYGSGIAVDNAGNAYVTGYTWSDESTFPVTIGPDLACNGNHDVFVAKVSAGGTELIYCGFIGGSLGEMSYDIAVDAAGCAYITGYTGSDESTFPVTTGPDLTYNDYADATGYADAFVAKLNPFGTALEYCGYIGGGYHEEACGIAVDVNGCAYVVGYAWSSEATFPVLVGPDLSHNGDNDIFVAKVSSDGASLEYCGYIGGQEGDYGYAIAVDGLGQAYVAGGTLSNESTFPVLVGPSLIYKGLDFRGDGFVAKIAASGEHLVYCGYLGGSDEEGISGIAVDDSGHAYVSGYTASDESTFPVGTGPDLTHNGGYDVFVAKVADSGIGLVYCGYIGGDGNDGGGRIALDGSDCAYVAGSTDSSETTFPVTAGPGLTYNGGFGDCFAAKLDPSGRMLVYCGYIGGDDVEGCMGIAVDNQGGAYLAGYTFSTEATFPATVGPQATASGGGDAFVAAISPFAPEVAFSISAAPSSATVTAGQSATFAIQATPQYGPVDSTITLLASGLPRGCTASFAPAGITPGAAPVSSTLTLRTTARSSSAGGGVLAAYGWAPPAWGLLLVFPVVCLLALNFSWVQGHLRHRWVLAGSIVCLIVLLGGCSADGGGNTPSAGTPAGTYTITVQGVSGSLAASTQVTLDVR